jgi:hypothetical protein
VDDVSAQERHEGFRIVGTVLKFYRLKMFAERGHEFGRGRLARMLGIVRHEEKIGADAALSQAKSIIRRAEEGHEGYAFVQRYAGLLVETLGLSGRETTNLLGAADAEKFLFDLTKKPNTSSPEVTYDQAPGIIRSRRSFEGMLLLPFSEERRWIREVFTRNKLPIEFRNYAPDFGNGKHAAELNDALEQELVTKNVLSMIQKALITEWNQIKEKATDDVSHFIIYLARAFATSEEDNVDRKCLKQAILDRFPQGKSSVARRNVAIALWELNDPSCMCAYLADSAQDMKDRMEAIRYLQLRSADGGDYVRVMKTIMRYLEWARLMQARPLLALELRTARDALVAQPNSMDVYRSPLSDIRAISTLESIARELSNSAPQRLVGVPCRDNCQCDKTIVEASREILACVGDYKSRVVIAFSKEG